MFIATRDKLLFEGLVTRMEKKCSRCSGTGFIAAYAHVDGGRCMACKGAGVKAAAAKVVDPEARVVLGTVAVGGQVGQVVQCSEHGQVVRVVVLVGSRVHHPRFGRCPDALGAALLAAFPGLLG